MSDTEKITVNLGAVDLGKIDLLVDQGLYSNRTDLIRTAIRNQLERHGEVVRQAVTRREMTVGVLVHGAKDLEGSRERGQKLRLAVVGMLVLTSDVTPELADQTIESIDLFGVFRAPPAVREILAGRVRQFATLYRA